MSGPEDDDEHEDHPQAPYPPDDQPAEPDQPPQEPLTLPDKSPWETIDIEFFERPDAAGVARVSSRLIGVTAGDAALVGEVIVRLSRVLIELARASAATISGRFADPQLAGLRFGDSVDIEFAVGDEQLKDDLITGVASPTINASHALTDLLTVGSEDQLLERLRRLGDDPAWSFSHLLRALSEDNATLDWQSARDRRPARVTGTTAAALIAAIERPAGERRDERWFDGRVTRADSDANELRIRLRERWQRREVIPATYHEELEPRLEPLWNKEVRAHVRVIESWRSGQVRPTLTFELIDIAPIPRLPGMS